MPIKTNIDTLFNPEIFEHVRCNFCGKDDTDADILFEPEPQRIPAGKEELMDIYSSAGRDIFYERLLRCKNCGLIYLSPRPKAQLIIDGYTRSEDRRYLSQEKTRQRTYRNCIKIIKNLRESGRLLDVGAACGIFVKVARDAGYDACGIEPSVWMCKVAKDYYNVSVLPAVLEEAKFADNSFDIITMWDVLEHILDPMRTLKEVKRILRPGGLLLINCPCIDDPLAKIFGRHWWFLVSIHLFYFNSKTLSLYLDSLGFEKIMRKMHIQRLTYGYLVERLNVYSPVLAKIAKFAYIIPNFKNFAVPYFASQYLTVAKNKK